ncbi:MAG: hypothetical protein HY529_00490 [Chloroflexi bacterium]|nr:hypothetical protein [Chloroflexota bacterium]
MTNRKEAITLALQTAGIEGLNSDILGMFESMADTEKANTESDRAIGVAVKSRYGNKATWRADRWFVPVPRLQFQGKDVPQLVIEVNTYLVAAANVRTPQDSRLVTLVGNVGKPEIMSIPMIFLHAILERDLGRFAMIARDPSYTTWEVPGAKAVRLPNEFINMLSHLLGWQSVVAWLERFGSQGRCVAPLVAGTLLGLAFQNSIQPVSVDQQMMTTDSLIGALEGMAYQPAEAREMVRLAAPRLRADMTLEEAIRITLQMGKEATNNEREVQQG